MKARMTHAARSELANSIRSRYSAASGKAKRRILDEFIAASGYHEKSAIRVLSEVPAGRGVAVGTKTYRVFNDKWKICHRDIFKDHWAEMVECLEEQPDQTALELLVEFQVRYPGKYSQRQLYTLQKRVRVWRQQAVQRLINEVSLTTAPHSISHRANQ